MQRGFTLIELLVVVAIIGLIVAIAIPALQTAIDKSKQRGTMADMRSIGAAVNYYQIDESAFPANGTTSSALSALLQKYTRNYLPSKDRWNHIYEYSSDGMTWYSIESFGKDGIDGVDITPSTKLLFEQDLVFASGLFSNAPE